MWLLTTSCGLEYYLAPGTWTLGRKNQAIVVESKAVSRTHCAFEVAAPEGDGAALLRVRDAGSKFGTYAAAAAGAPFAKLAAHADVELAHNAVLSLGGDDAAAKTVTATWRPVAICLSRCNKTVKKAVTAAAATGGARIVSAIGDATHLVTKEPTTTAKVIVAVLKGLAVVHPS